MGKIDRLLVRYGGNVVQLAIALWALAFVAAFAGLLRPNWRWAIYLVCTVAVTAIVVQWTRTVRERYIREARLPAYLKRKLRETYPHLSQKDCELVERGLRQFFMACMRSRKQFVAMPSKAVDALWHDFILHTQAYKTWCHNALGFFLQRRPAPRLVLGVQGRSHQPQGTEPPAAAVRAGRQDGDCRRLHLPARLQQHFGQERRGRRWQRHLLRHQLFRRQPQRQLGRFWWGRPFQQQQRQFQRRRGRWRWWLRRRGR